MRLACCALLKHVSRGRADAWQLPSLVPEEMGRAAVAAGEFLHAWYPLPLALSSDQSRPRRFKIGQEAGEG